jgi:hypothetical protein
MRAVKTPNGTLVVLATFLAVPGLAQTSLNVSSPMVLLNSGEARSVTVSASKGGPLAYTVADKPSWLNTSSANNYTAPDTLYFQIANSLCGTCSATMTLLPAGGGEATPVTVKFSPDTGPLQTQLAVSPPSVNLNNTQARSITVSAFRNSAVSYAVTGAPSWLTVTSANNYTTPDRLSFQLANSICGTCTATIGLRSASGSAATSVAVTYNVSAGSSYRAAASHVTLTYPAGAGGLCGSGFMSSCTVGVTANVASVKQYSARINPGAGDNWLLMNNAVGFVNGAPLANGLNLAVNANAAGSLPTGAYSGQVVIYNPADQSDLLLVNVSLLVNPGSITISPTSGMGSSQTFTMQFPHPGGWQRLSVLNVLIGNSLEARHACYLAYEVPIATLHLTDDDAKIQGTARSLTADRPGPAANSQCGVRLLSAKGEGNTLTLTLNLSFSSGFAGKKTIYLADQDQDHNNTGWLATGTWEVRPAPAPRKGTPARKPAGGRGKG